MTPRRPTAARPLIDRVVGWVSPEAGLRRMAARRRLELSSQFRGAEQNRLRADWVISQDGSTPDSWELDTLRKRSRDLNRNDAVAAGATDTLGLNIVGQGLKPQSRIRGEVLGVTDTRARDLQRQCERVWELWCPMADSANRIDFGEIQFLAMRKIVEDGEVLCLPVMAGEPWRRLRRAVELIEADRLSPPDKKSSFRSDTGIDVGSRGEPVRYWIRVADQKRQVAAPKWQPYPARDRNGRPVVLHVFQQRRPGQMRGVPFFAPVLNYFKDLSDYLEAEVVAARVAACLAVFVTKENAYSAAYGNATDTEMGTGNRIQGVEPGLVGYLEPGESINVVDPKRPGDSFQPFVSGILRMIGTSLNLPYELLVKDFSQTNYSSARAALLEGRRMFTTWRGWFSRRFCQPVYELVMEEAYLRGMLEAPDFYRFREEYCRCQWIGGGWGWVDPVKEVDAARKAIDYGLSTQAQEVASQGGDWEEVLEQQKREQDRARELGVRLITSEKQRGDSDAKAQEK